MRHGGIIGAGQGRIAQPDGDSVVVATETFAMKRGTEGLETGDLVIIQTARAGQIPARIVGWEVGGAIRVRFSRWSLAVTVEPEQVLCRVPGAV